MRPLREIARFLIILIGSTLLLSFALTFVGVLVLAAYDAEDFVRDFLDNLQEWAKDGKC